MNPILTTVKTTLKFVILSVLFVPTISLADAFVKIQELTNTFKSGIFDINTSEDGRYVFIEDAQQVYWLMSTARPFSFHKIFNDGPVAPFPFDYKSQRRQNRVLQCAKPKN